jgi:hypothetical protein
MPALRGDRVQLAQQNEVCVLTAAGPFSARIIVDATVRASWLSRRLGIARGARSPWLIARYGYAAGFCSGLDEAPELVGDSKGSVWAAMVQPGLYHSTRVASDGFRPHQSWVPANLHRLTPVGSSRGADVTWRMVAHTEHPAWFIVGDAACLLDPRIALRLRRSFISTGCPSGLRWRPSVLRHSISHFPRRQRDPPAPKRFTTISSAEDIFALCAASTCTPTGKQITVRTATGGTAVFPEADCTCPILFGESFANRNAGPGCYC